MLDKKDMHAKNLHLGGVPSNHTLYVEATEYTRLVVTLQVIASVKFV